MAKRKDIGRDEVITIGPAVGVAVGMMLFGVIGGLMGLIPRNFWIFLFLIAAGFFLTAFLELTPPVLRARARLINKHIIEPASFDEEPDFSSDVKDKETNK